MSAFCRCTRGHWNALAERWNVGEWSRACCGQNGCGQPLHPRFTYQPPDQTLIPVGRLGQVAGTCFYRCVQGHWNLAPYRLVQAYCGSASCFHALELAAAQQKFDAETEFHAAQDGGAQALMLATRHLNTRDRVALSAVNRSLANESREQGYDPFGGNTMLGNQQGGGGQAPQSLTHLAKHAFNQLYRTVKEKFTFNAPLTSGDLKLQKWSTDNAFGNPQTRKSFISTNCQAQTSIGGSNVNAVNFVHYGGSEGERLIKALDLDKQPSLPLQRYTQCSHKHGEVRLAEAQDNAYERAPISVDKLCCLFCAAQMEALGRTPDLTGATTGILQWYTFTPYVMYFRDRRSLMWGTEVEAGFARLSRENKIAFLRILADLAKSPPFNTTQHSPVYTGLPSISDVIQNLPP
ncbi:MAG TPA: hypothetical protein VEQ60_17600 [Longimicrobium sp.]|nr:hypothetical protein [Longimicrobium sp.]